MESGRLNRGFLLQVLLGAVIAGIVLFALAADARAREDETGAPRDPLLERIEKNEAVASRTNTAREAVNTRTEQVREQLSERVRDRIHNLFLNLARRMHAAIDRLTNISKRLLSRAEKLDANGIDTTKARRLVSEAHSELTLAEALITRGEEGGIFDVIGSEKPRDAFVTLKEEVRIAAAHMRSAHQLLRDAVAALKSALREAEGERGVRDAVVNDIADGGTASEDETDDEGDGGETDE